MTDEMSLDEQRAAELLDAYWLALAINPTAAPPPGLEPALADVAWCLAVHLDAPEPDPAHVEGLRRELEAEASSLRLNLSGSQ
jgi:hypothetical protein